MKPYQFYPGYVHPQTDLSAIGHSYPYRLQHEEFVRQQTPTEALEQRLNVIERQNEQQVIELSRQNQEIARLNNEIGRINQEIARLNQNDELHTGRLNRLNQRLRTVESRLNIPYTGAADGF